MGANRNPEVSAKVAEAKRIMEADPSRSFSSVATEVGLSRPTLQYRLDHPSVPDRARDELPEEVRASEIPVYVRDYSDQKDHRIYPIGDLHIGSPEHQDDTVAEWLAYLERTPNVSMLNTGDNTNCALSSSVSDEYGEKLTVKEARQLQTKLFAPLAVKDKIDCVIDGNHEDRVYRSTGDTPNSAVCDALGINYERAHAIVRYLVGDQVYDVYLRHGKGGGGTFGAQVNNLEKQERIIDADIYVSGHTHTQLAFVKDHFVRVHGEADNRAGFVRRKRLFVCSGSFVGYEEYAAAAGYAPAHIGAPRIFLSGERKDAHASV